MSALLCNKINGRMFKGKIRALLYFCNLTELKLNLERYIGFFFSLFVAFLFQKTTRGDRGAAAR